jgi:hypothetical protein
MSPELDTFKRYQGGAIQGAWSGCFQGYRGDAMQDLGYELPRIPIPCTPVNIARTRGAHHRDVSHDIDGGTSLARNGVDDTMPFRTHRRTGADGYGREPNHGR